MNITTSGPTPTCKTSGVATPSMSLVISHSNATRMLEASRSLNVALHKIKQEYEDGSGESCSSSSPDIEIANGRDIRQLTSAANSSKNQLLSAHIRQLQRDTESHKEFTDEEIATCLLLFLDMGKSSKLLGAFQILSGEIQVAKDGQDGASDVDMDSKQTHSLDTQGVNKLFKCFLFSISTCIYFEERDCEMLGSSSSSNERIKAARHSLNGSPNTNEPRNDIAAQNEENVDPYHKMRSTGLDNKNNCSWTLPAHRKNDIEEFANYATNKVLEHIKTEEAASLTPTQGDQERSDPIVSFKMFGDWYNSGGFSLVPWLELLDLAKWDYAGRAAASAAAAEAAKEKHRARVLTTRNVNNNSAHPTSQDGSRRDPHGSCSSSAPGRPNMRPTAASGLMKPIAEESFSNIFNSPQLKEAPQSSSRTLLTFEFAGSDKHSIDITDDNVRMLQDLVHRTGLRQQTTRHVADILLRHSERRYVRSQDNTRRDNRIKEVVMVLNRQDFGKCVRHLVPDASKSFSQVEMEKFSNYFTNFFLCFAKDDNRSPGLDIDYINARELAVGFSFLCAGNKSAKLAETFAIINEQDTGYLTQHMLLRYLRSYLRMLVGISLLSSCLQTTKHNINSLDARNEHVMALCRAADLGASWTLDHFLRRRDATSMKHPVNPNRITFEEFASWYSEGGYTIAPWLECIDHKKFVNYLGEDRQATLPTRPSSTSRMTPPQPPLNPPTSTGKIRSFDEFLAGSPSPTPTLNKTPRPARESAPVSSGDILRTFPLAKGRNLIVLREDAAYVRAVVEQLGLLSTAPESVWTKFFNHTKKNAPTELLYHQANRHRSGSGKACDVDQKVFVAGVLKSVPAKCKRKRASSPLPSTPHETLKNFFLSFDLDQVDRVAANQLMGGLTLLCGGNKTSKLSFAFDLFDMRTNETTRQKKKKNTRDVKSLCGKELFYFMRSFLIVMFSCCKQSLDLTADCVGRYISDTANMVTDDVMKYQYRVRKVDRINFDEFGEWYNEGGFEIAPWLELLDLNKWVLLDHAKAEKLMAEAKPMKVTSSRQPKEENMNELGLENKIEGALKNDDDVGSDLFGDFCPLPPPDEDLDADQDDLFGDAMEEIDGFELLVFNESGSEKENIESELNMDIPMPTELPSRPVNPNPQKGTPLNFRLMTNNKTNYTVSVSPRRVNLLRQIVLESGIYDIDKLSMCDKILAMKKGSTISKETFDTAVNDLLRLKCRPNMSKDIERIFYDLLSSIFHEFDKRNTNNADASELACGLTILCGGSKSDKLEYCFELLDGKKKGLVSRIQMVKYLYSFLTVLLNISSCKLGDEPSENILFTSSGEKAEGGNILQRVIGWVSSWATEEVFKATPEDRKENVDGTECINFDNFATWYTKGGYHSIAWLELLDLKKWILSN